jgi:uncharacterized protein (TIGR02284 family)
MAQNNTIDELNHLIGVNKNAEEGLRGASESVKNSELETLFSGYAKQHARFADELQEEVKRLGGTSSESGIFGGAVHRGWMELKAALTGGSAASILKSCESGEQSAEIAYTDAMDAHITGQTHTLISKHAQQIKGFRTHLARLVGETKDGVDFQKNE